MDVFTRDLENWWHEFEVSDTRHAELLESLLAERIFSDHSDQSNVEYAYELVKWVGEHFDYLEVAGSAEFSSSELPESLSLMVAKVWQSKDEEPQTLYSEGSRVIVKNQIEEKKVHIDTPASRLIQQMIDEGFSIQEIIDTTKSMTELEDNLIDELCDITKTFVEEFTTIRWIHPESFSSGVNFVVSPEGIRIDSFGELEITRKLNQFLLTYHDKPRELALVASRLAVLGAKYCHSRSSEFTTPRREIDELQLRLDEL